MTMMEAAPADDAGMEPEAQPPSLDAPLDHPLYPAIANALRGVFDPEIPVNIYELGLVYKVEIDAANNVALKMTLTAPGCGMGPSIASDAQRKILTVPGVSDVDVELVWEPAWHPGMMAETAKLQLGMF